jgi:fumarate hydratase subunit alpha
VSATPRHLDVGAIRDAVRALALEAEFALDGRTLEAIRSAAMVETSALGRGILGEIDENARLAVAEHRPLCQDTGLAIVWIERGTEVCLTGGSLCAAVDEGVRAAWRQGGFRASVVADPFDRRNTSDNTPAFVHLDEMPGDRVRVHFLAKGGGSENQSCLAVLKPSQGRAGVVAHVIDEVSRRAAFACPPLIVGVGIGGPADGAAWSAKRALFRPVGRSAADAATAAIEREILAGVNSSGVGPMGLGGRTTALACHVECAPCHIASLPVAVSVNCHSHRTGSVEL